MDITNDFVGLLDLGCKQTTIEGPNKQIQNLFIIKLWSPIHSLTLYPQDR